MTCSVYLYLYIVLSKFINYSIHLYRDNREIKKNCKPTLRTENRNGEDDDNLAIVWFVQTAISFISLRISVSHPLRFQMWEKKSIDSIDSDPTAKANILSSRPSVSYKTKNQERNYFYRVHRETV